MAPQKTCVNNKKPKRSKDPNAPKKPTTAYFLFMAEKRAEVKNANPNFKAEDVAKELSKMWAGIDVAEKERLEKKAAKLKEVYAKKKAASPKEDKKNGLKKKPGVASKKIPAKAAKQMSVKKKETKKGSKRLRLGNPGDGYEADTEDSDLD